MIKRYSMHIRIQVNVRGGGGRKKEEKRKKVSQKMKLISVVLILRAGLTIESKQYSAIIQILKAIKGPVKRRKKSLRL